MELFRIDCFSRSELFNVTGGLCATYSLGPLPPGACAPARLRVLHWCANTAPPLRGGAPRDLLNAAGLNPNFTSHFKKSKSV